MSVDAGVTLRLLVQNDQVSVLDALLASKWSTTDEGWWCIPLGEDTSGWTLLAGSDQAPLIELFRAKLAAQEPFGIRLWWDHGAAGGEFMVYSNGDVVFSPSLNRVKLGARTTDVSWNLSRLLSVFSDPEDIALEGWTWLESA